jgi:hypothetical protein
MPDFRPISPTVRIYSKEGAKTKAHEVFGWWTDGTAWAHIHPVVANPDGPGVGPWFRFYGEDPWHTA